mgnify:CR=1 FL=1
MDEVDLGQLKEAKRRLENPGIGARLAHLVGSPVEHGLKRLPDKALQQITKVEQLVVFQEI